MIAFHRPRLGLLLVLGLMLLVGRHVPAAPPSTVPVEGLRQNTPAVHALTNLRIVPEPGKVIEKGTIVIRDGVIEAVGADVKLPADAAHLGPGRQDRLSRFD